MTRRTVPLLTLTIAMFFLAGAAFAQSDPGVRPGSPGAGGPLPGMTTDEVAFFNGAREVFKEVDSVSGTIESGSGLGPRFNSRSCAFCHAQPDVGGTSPFTNPQMADATADGATNTIPSFIQLHGPVREARFIRNPDGTPDGGVHDLFTITGRSDAKNRTNVQGVLTSCNIAQPDFATALAQNNVIFRIPTPIFGLGLVELTSDTTLINNSTNPNNANFGISGVFNRSGNDGTITRVGWKAQNKSLLIFATEAYNVEQGVTNEGFPQEREENPNCQFNALPEDTTNLTPRSPSTGSNAADFSSDVVDFAAFMRLSAPPTPVAFSLSAARGERTFEAIGCALCHVESQQTVGQSSLPSGQGKKTFRPFSDFKTHNMGAGLADHVTQGAADGF
ncbi:MAG TPA: di-heme oxidoredictase family protein, partial [Candidatus Acidoferrales bacterium]|nr:di-heme oxidoredictase family protein [Candidatus Acidoferrales bacterium]